MLMIGVKGLAKEVLELIYINKEPLLFFYDDVSSNVPETLFGLFKIMAKADEARELFLINSSFALGVGNPKVRKMLVEKRKVSVESFIL